MEKIWLKRSEEWIKANPGKGTMYKAEITPEVKLEEMPTRIREQMKRVGGDAGVYGIICEKSKRAYIGQSINIQTRLRSHRHCLLRDHNKNLVYKDMIADVKMYGLESFQFVALEVLQDTSNIIDYESEYMFKYTEMGYRLYNIQPPINNVYIPLAIKPTFEALLAKCKANPEFIDKLNSILYHHQHTTLILPHL